MGMVSAVHAAAPRANRMNIRLFPGGPSLPTPPRAGGVGSPRSLLPGRSSQALPRAGGGETRFPHPLLQKTRCSGFTVQSPCTTIIANS